MNKERREHGQPEVNIGLTGHVDHGKSTLVEALTGKWPATHSEELKRGITIKLGYANATFRKCPNCPEPQAYTVKKKCPICGSETQVLRKVSFVDCPGHESLMAVMLAGATIMDGAILVIAADEPCPQPQTREHLAALLISGIKNIVVVQNKIELVDDEEAVENFKEIKQFLENNNLGNVPIIPVSALHKANLDVLIQHIERVIPTPERDLSLDPLLYIARSFDINKPGTTPEKLQGGVIGGSVVRGRFKIGDEIEIKPGIEISGKYTVLHSVIRKIRSEREEITEAKPGGLIAFQTSLDPSLTKADNLMGNVVGRKNKLPPVWFEIEIDTELFREIVGLAEKVEVKSIELNENLMLTVGTSATLGRVVEKKKKYVKMKLVSPVCAEIGQRVALGRKVKGRWRLIGYGRIKG